MKVSIRPGQTLIIEFDDEQGNSLDGQFTVEFTKTSLTIRESAGLPGSVKGGANEVLYQEDFG